MRTFNGTLIVLALLLAGCGSGDDGPSGTLSGTVTHLEKPVPEGSTIVVEGAGTVATAKVGADGAFRIEGESGKLIELPVGEYRVAVMPAGGEGLSQEEVEKYMAEGKSPPAPDHAQFPVPKQFRNTVDTPARVQVAEGANEEKIELKPR